MCHVKGLPGRSKILTVAWGENCKRKENIGDFVDSIRRKKYAEFISNGKIPFPIFMKKRRRYELSKFANCQSRKDGDGL